MQPKSKVNVVNSSFNDIFNSLDKNSLKKEKEPIETKKLEDNRDEDSNLTNNNYTQESSSKLIFGNLNISKSSNLHNIKGKEISSSSLMLNNENNEINPDKRKLNIVSTVNHCVFSNNNINNNDNDSNLKYISNDDVEKIVGNYKYVINNVIKREILIQNNLEKTQNHSSNDFSGDKEAYIVDDENTSSNELKHKEKDDSVILKMENNFMNENIKINNITKSLSSCNISQDNLEIENIDNIDMNSDIDNTSIGQISNLIIDKNSDSIEIENAINKSEKKSNTSSIQSSNNSLNSTDSNIINNMIYLDDSYKKTSGDSNKMVNRNNSSSSESLVEKSFNHQELHSKENSNIELSIASTKNILSEIKIITKEKTNESDILHKLNNYLLHILYNNSALTNCELTINTQNFIYLNKLNPIFMYDPSHESIQVSIDIVKYFNFMSSLFSSSLPLNSTKKINSLRIKFNLESSVILSKILLFFYNLNLSLNRSSQHSHYELASTFQKFKVLEHLKKHIQTIVNNDHSFSCTENIFYLKSIQQYQIYSSCSKCQTMYFNLLKVHECQCNIRRQIKTCKKCMDIINLLESNYESKSIKDNKQNNVDTEIKEEFTQLEKISYKLDTLPPEILLNIFDQFNKNTDKQNFRFTCTRFRKTLYSPNVLNIKRYDQLNYLKNLINVKNVMLKIDIFFKDLELLEISDTTFQQIKNLVLYCDIQNMSISTDEYSKKLINTAFSSFSTLTNLTIRQVNRRDIFNRMFSPRQLVLPSLKHIQFEECKLSPRTLKPWEKISMPSLESVVIDEKSELSYIPSFLRNVNLIELKCHFKNDLWMSGEYNNLETLIVELDYKDDFNELFIKENTYMPQLKSLLLMNNKKNESLPISPKLSDLTIVCDEFSKEDLIKLPECYPELSVLNIECPLDFSFPSNFTSLKSLRLEFVPTILNRIIPAMPHLTSLHIERGEHVILNGVFPELKYVIVESCDKINFTGKFNAVEWIKFRNCNNLRTIDWDFPSLNSLSLEGCFFLTSIADKYPLLQTLNVKLCKNFYKIPNNLTKLNTLNVLQCDNFISVSSNFKSLTMLNVSHCRIFSYIPRELENLEWLLLEDCNNIHQIPHLDKLHHFKCLRCKNIPFPFSPCKFFPNIRSFAVTTLNKN
ncbi:hypothetical protein BCR36DRAFT_406743 [Piromyces finnis]|uniref:F-box domain-containing protein n=1 Tax=Piromyces finnis TaxID=1754191 RepID=A0A1Y1UZT8_9FUNG|nr:hypothetical protein BCR36DRAFT_406743 [Piromyces finnis]|eukprot:ORX43370.1 hypothetical protein BCR36DRAFT_406743 [Piromyces finnis]